MKKVLVSNTLTCDFCNKKKEAINDEPLYFEDGIIFNNDLKAFEEDGYVFGDLNFNQLGTCSPYHFCSFGCFINWLSSNIDRARANSKRK